MKLVQLKYFLAVCKYGTFSGAAKDLFISQPAISQTIRELESEYHVRLFDRTNNRLVVTEDGKWLYAKAQDIVRRVDEVDKELRERSENRSSVKIGIAPMAGSVFLYPLVKEMRAAYPGIVPDLREAGSLELRRWLDSNSIDLAFGTMDCMDSAKFASYTLGEEEFMYCVHKSHPLANRERVTWSQVAEYSVCMFREDSYQNSIIKQKVAEFGLSLNVLMYTSQLNSIFTMLAYGECGAFLFEKVLKKDSDFVAIPIEDPVRLKVGLCWDGQQQESIPVRTVRKFLISNFKKNAENQQ